MEPSTSESFQDEPRPSSLKLIWHAESGNLQLNPAVLNACHSDQPFSLISVIGGSGSGKSLLASAIVSRLGVDFENNVFVSSNRVNGTTLGCDVTNILNTPHGPIMVADTEGLGLASVKSMLKLLAPTMLMSTIIVLNYPGGRMKAEDLLSQLALVGQACATVAGGCNEDVTLGHVVIAIRDWASNDASVQDELDRLLNDEAQTEDQNARRHFIKKTFASFSAIGIPRPHARSEHLDVDCIPVRETSASFLESVHNLIQRHVLPNLSSRESSLSSGTFIQQMDRYLGCCDRLSDLEDVSSLLQKTSDFSASPEVLKFMKQIQRSIQVIEKKTSEMSRTIYETVLQTVWDEQMRQLRSCTPTILHQKYEKAAEEMSIRFLEEARSRRRKRLLERFKETTSGIFQAMLESSDILATESVSEALRLSLERNFGNLDEKALIAEFLQDMQPSVAALVTKPTFRELLGCLANYRLLKERGSQGPAEELLDRFCYFLRRGSVHELHAYFQILLTCPGSNLRFWRPILERLAEIDLTGLSRVNLCSLGSIFHKLGIREKAKVLLDRIIASDEQNSLGYAFATRALIWEEEGDLTKATLCIEQALSHGYQVSAKSCAHLLQRFLERGADADAARLRAKELLSLFSQQRSSVEVFEFALKCCELRLVSLDSALDVMKKRQSIHLCCRLFCLSSTVDPTAKQLSLAFNAIMFLPFVPESLQDQTMDLLHHYFAAAGLREAIEICTQRKAFQVLSFFRRLTETPLDADSESFDAIKALQSLSFKQAPTNIFSLAFDGNGSGLETSLQASPTLIDACLFGCPLMVAAVLGERAEIVKCLLNRGCDTSVSFLGYTPLDFAVMKRSEELVSLLAPLLLRGDRAAASGQSLHLAIRFRCSPSILKSLVENGVPVDAFDQLSRTPLYYACRRAWPDGVKILLELGANPNMLNTPLGRTAMSIAASRGSPELIELLKGTATCAGEPISELCPLPTAIHSGQYHLIETLWNMLESDSSITPPRRRAVAIQAVRIAQEQQNPPIVSLLASLGAPSLALFKFSIGICEHCSSVEIPLCPTHHVPLWSRTSTVFACCVAQCEYHTSRRVCDVCNEGFTEFRQVVSPLPFYDLVALCKHHGLVELRLALGTCDECGALDACWADNCISHVQGDKIVGKKGRLYNLDVFNVAHHKDCRASSERIIGAILSLDTLSILEKIRDIPNIEVSWSILRDPENAAGPLPLWRASTPSTGTTEQNSAPEPKSRCSIL
eukprot:TRINITY_DN2249_c0_g1_i5.p1 TRINITY_DN2249_c0_g1~~TRINITY_DN2249_c0_g1_i5.p1  ORF type:complete len:1248 (+),score=129.44 TRINITY_DN2249_c0_g1_i5:124-3867(+)